MSSTASYKLSSSERFVFAALRPDVKQMLILTFFVCYLHCSSPIWPVRGSHALGQRGAGASETRG